jgi:hypothetical protein
METIRRRSLRVVGPRAEVFIHMDCMKLLPLLTIRRIGTWGHTPHRAERRQYGVPLRGEV